MRLGEKNIKFIGRHHVSLPANMKEWEMKELFKKLKSKIDKFY